MPMDSPQKVPVPWLNAPSPAQSSPASSRIQPASSPTTASAATSPGPPVTHSTPSHAAPAAVSPASPSPLGPKQPTPPTLPPRHAGKSTSLSSEPLSRVISPPTRVETQGEDIAEVAAVQAEIARVEEQKAIKADVKADEGLNVEGDNLSADADTVVDGIEDEALWALMRTFSTQVNHVLHAPESAPPAQPDLRMTNLPDVAYRSDTLKANFERVIGALGPSAMRGFTEVVRLTDWELEPVRTSLYCGAYFITWLFGYTMLGCGIFFIVLICFPKTRRILFPPIELPGLLEDGDGTIPRPRTRAARGEVQAYEARALFDAYTQAVVFGRFKVEPGNAKVGRKGGQPVPKVGNPVIDDKGDIIGEKTATGDDTVVIVGDDGVAIVDGEHRDAGADSVEHESRDEMVAKMAKGTETGLGTVADFFEIFQNALSPPVPYPDYHARFKIAAAFVAVPTVMFQYTPPWVWGRIITFVFGAALWGRPLATRAARIFVKYVPNWAELIDLRNSILSGTPTNAQLVLHLLRVCEDMDDPLPAPPAAPVQESPLKAADDPSGMGGTVTDIQVIKEAGGQTVGVMAKTKSKTKAQFSSAFKKMTRKLAGISGDVAVDGEHTNFAMKVTNGLLKRKYSEDSMHGYAAKLKGVPGHIIIDDAQRSITWSAVAFTKPQHLGFIDDLVEVKKDSVGMTRIALGLMGGADVESLGIEIRFAEPGARGIEPDIKPNGEDGTYQFKSVIRREQLFNRLLAIGSQRWEIL